MGTHDPRVDAYIENAAEFAQPVLEHLREIVHAACPEVVETIKWRMPMFEHKGLLCHFASFKQHCAFGFWKHTLLFDGQDEPAKGMGSFGKLTSVKDLPSKRELTALVKKAVKLNEQGIARDSQKSKPVKPATEMPSEFKTALAKQAKARKFFESLAPGYQREYVEWIADAKREATRDKRIDQAIEWLGESKKRNWKYESC